MSWACAEPPSLSILQSNMCYWCMVNAIISRIFTTISLKDKKVKYSKRVKYSNVFKFERKKEYREHYN